MAPRIIRELYVLEAVLAAVALVSLAGNSPGAHPVHGLQSCGDGCQSGDDCDGQLTCIQGQCNDDLNVGTTLCSEGGGTSSHVVDRGSTDSGSGTLQGCGLSCQSGDDCDGDLACIQGECTDHPEVGTTLCSDGGRPDSGSGTLQGCGDSCLSGDECDGDLTCIQGHCNDDPEVGTSICRSSGGDGNGASAPAGAPDHNGKKKKKSDGGSANRGDSNTCDATAENPSSCCDSDSCHKTSCSPAVTGSTHAILTVNSFQAGGDGGATSECDESYHSDSDSVVALSTGWYDHGSRCGKQIIIHGNGATTMATVVDECDSRNGCDADHAGQPPCRNNIVDASDAVWQALGVSSDDDQLYGSMDITWEDA